MREAWITREIRAKMTDKKQHTITMNELMISDSEKEIMKEDEILVL